MAGSGKSYTHNECRQLASASSDLMLRIVDQLIGEVLQAQGEAIVRKTRQACVSEVE